MDASLNKWQQQLEAHFEALATERRFATLPVFAIEHGLDGTEIDEIAALLRKRLAYDDLVNTHWLLWAVYAAELGYDYDGAEYWPSFERRTPRWGIYPERRRYLRECFAKFHKKFVGAHPTGPWAGQFTIIAWPITHALLPKDLQTQLARVLYEQRYMLAEFADAPPSQVGRLIAASAFEESSRLRNFLEQEELVGRIVLALLGLKQADAIHSILPKTLDRIIADLEAKRDARVWLHEARTAVALVRTNLSARTLRHEDTRDTSAYGRHSSANTTTIRPRLILLREPEKSWKVVLELPSFEGIAGLSPDLATFLRTTRCTVDSVGMGWNSSGWLLYGAQKKKLTSWPHPANAVVRFEVSDVAIEHLLQTECKISKGPLWLFQIHEDGSASEKAGLNVRPGQDYVLIRTDTLPAHPLITPVSLSCSGAVAGLLSIAPETSHDVLHSLLELGLGVEGTLRVWPAGLPARRWNGDNNAEWFVGEVLCIGVSHDNLCTGFSVSIDGHKECDVAANTLNLPTFLSLGRLAPGRHTLTVSANYRGAEAGKTVHSSRAKATMSILVRAPYRWIPGTSSHAGLVVTTEPYEPALDSFLDGRVTVSIVGPEGKEVTCALQLLDGTGNVLIRELIGKIRLPMEHGVWTHLMEQQIKREIDPALLLLANAGRLLIDGDELGIFSVELRHSVAPLRWIIETQHGTSLRLVDDSAHEDSLAVQFVSFQHPITPTQCNFADLSTIFRPTEKGGLYVAAVGTYRARVVVSVWNKGGLQELAIRPDLNFVLKEIADIDRFLFWIRDWSVARIVGPLASARRSLVVQGMRQKLYEAICGNRWMQAEHKFLEIDAETRTAEVLEAELGNPIAFVIGLQQQREKLLSKSISGSAQCLLALATPHNQCHEIELCEAALRLAAAPETFIDWAGPESIRILGQLRQIPRLLRGIRMLVLLSTDSELQVSEAWS